MKRLIFILALIPIITFGQAGKSPVVTTNTAQTITGQKNFSGTVKFRSDTSITMGGLVGGYALGLDYYLKTANSYIVPLRFNALDAYTAPWTITSGEVDFTPSVTGKDHVFNIGYNWTGGVSTKSQFGQQMEAFYEQNDTTVWYEWFSYYNDLPAPSTVYNTRPFQVATVRYGSSAPYRYTSSVVTNADLFAILDERNASLIEFRTQTYGATANETTIGRGRLQDAFGNSLMYIVDSLWIFHNINNMRWLWQANSVGSAKELMRIDNNDRLLLAPSTDTPIDFASPIYGTIYWADEAGAGEVPIYKESGTDRIYIGGTDGMVTSKLEVQSIPQSANGLDAGQFYIDNLTGSVQLTIPENLVENGTFTTWTGTGKSATPVGWTFNPDPRDTTAIYVEQNPAGQLHFVWDGSDISAYLLQDTSTIGANYGYSFEVTALTDSALIYIVGNGVAVTSTGTYYGTLESVANEKFKIFPRYGAGEITLDNMRLWLIGGNIETPSYDVPNVLDSLGVLIAGVGSTSTGNPDSLGGQPASAYLLKSDSTIYLTPSDARVEFLQISDSTIYLTPSGAATAYQPKNTDLDNPDLALNLLQDSLDVKMNRSEMSNYASASHTHTDFFDTLTVSFGVMDTVTTGDYPGWKVPNNITITEISAYTNTGTVTFNIEERAETTPNTAGTDLMSSDLVADTDQQEQTSFSNSTLDRNDWLVMNVTSISGDPTIFGVTIRYVKTN